MRIEKDKRKVVICLDRSVITGVIHINPGERISDFVNHTGADFLIVTNAELKTIGEVSVFKLFKGSVMKKGTIFLNKASINWIQEV